MSAQTLPTREQVAQAVQGCLSDLGFRLEQDGHPGIDTAEPVDENRVYFSGTFVDWVDPEVTEDGETYPEEEHRGEWGFTLVVEEVSRG
jgi:hypothetical protein